MVNVEQVKRFAKKYSKLQLARFLLEEQHRYDELRANKIDLQNRLRKFEKALPYVENAARGPLIDKVNRDAGGADFYPDLNWIVQNVKKAWKEIDN